MNKTLMVLAGVVSFGVVLLTAQGNAYSVADAEVAQLRMLVTGSGPAVVLESGLGAQLGYWRRTQREVSKFATVIAYDRAGIGGSSDGPLPRDGRQVATELHAALRDSGVPPPYVLTGHSLGGLYARIYASMYPDEVAALVLVDPTRHDEGDPDALVDETYPELNAMAATMQQARDAQLPAGLPIYLIMAMGARGEPWFTATDAQARQEFAAGREDDRAAHAKWISGHANARLIVTHDSGHIVPVEETALVVDTIRQALNSAAARR